MLFPLVAGVLYHRGFQVFNGLGQQKGLRPMRVPGFGRCLQFRKNFLLCRLALFQLLFQFLDGGIQKGLEVGVLAQVSHLPVNREVNTLSQVPRITADFIKRFLCHRPDPPPI